MLLLRETQEKVEEEPTMFACPKDGNQLVLTSIPYNKQLVVKCNYCKKNYFSYTERLHCKSCSLNCCLHCRQTLVKSGGKAPIALHHCSKGHKLTFRFLNKNRLQFCDGCMVIVRDEGFFCESENYLLCMTCVMTQPPNFIGKGLNSKKEIQGSENQLSEKDEDEESDEEEYYKNQKNHDYGAIFNGYEKPQNSQYDFGDFVNDIFG